MNRYILGPMVLLAVGFGLVSPVGGASIPIENASFEAPAVDPNGFGALPYADGWTELDIDTEGSTNTGVFANTPQGRADHIVNADGSQLAFLGSQEGNGFEQDLNATYQVGRDYRLTLGVAVSALFPPASEAPADAIELVLYYVDEPNSIDIAVHCVTAQGLSSTELKDFSVYLPKIGAGDAWAGKLIGVAIRSAGTAGGFWDLDNVRLEESLPVLVPIENASFEAPAVDPNGFGALPFAEGWTELDVDAEGSTNTGVFLNTPEGSPDRLLNADGDQLAFLGSQEGNGFEQVLGSVYVPGCEYRLTVAAGVSAMFPPSSEEPLDTVELVLYYVDGPNSVPMDIGTASQLIEATGLSSTQLLDFSAYLATVDVNDAWAGRPIGVAIRAAGMAGGFWDLDNVRLVESLPVAIPIENPSFESPVVDTNGFGALPYMDGWTELDVDAEGSTNTGVFANTPEGSPDRLTNADGSQLAFLGSEQGNSLEQDVPAVFEVGCTYRLTVAVGVSSRFPPSADDNLELVLVYRDGDQVVDVAQRIVEAPRQPSNELTDFSVYVTTVQDEDAWAGKDISIAIRAVGAAGGFWDLDDVRLAKSPSASETVAIVKE